MLVSVRPGKSSVLPFVQQQRTIFILSPLHFSSITPWNLITYKIKALMKPHNHCPLMLTSINFTWKSCHSCIISSSRHPVNSINSDSIYLSWHKQMSDFPSPASLIDLKCRAINRRICDITTSEPPPAQTKLLHNHLGIHSQHHRRGEKFPLFQKVSAHEHLKYYERP